MAEYPLMKYWKGPDGTVYEVCDEQARQNGGAVNIDNKTLVVEDGVLRVNTTNDMEQDNTLPITSAGVFATVGNISAILDTI